MPALVNNPVNGDDLTAQSITTNVTDKIVAWETSHEAGAATNGAVRHTSDQVDDVALGEVTTPVNTVLNQHLRNDTFAVSLSTIVGGAGVGYSGKIATLSGLTYGNITAINTELATNATPAATALRLARRRADGSADFAGTSAFVNITTSGTVVATGAVSGAAATFTGVITAGSGSVAITAADGHLNASALTGVLPAASFPAQTGDVTNASGTLTTTVATVGGKTAAAIATAVSATTAAAGTGVGNHGVLAKYDASGGMTFDATVTAPTFVGALTGTASAVPASGIAGTVGASQIDSAIARVANVPTNSGTGATGTWNIAISGSAGGVSVGAITTTMIGAGQVTGAKIAAFTVALANIVEGAVYPEGGTLRVFVNPLKKWNAANSPVSWTGGYLDMTAHVPGAGLYLYCLISVNGAGVAYVKEGVAASGGFSFAGLPTRDPNTTPLAVVALQAGQTTVGTLDIIDWRGPNEGAAGGAGGSQIGHDHGMSGEHRVLAVGFDEGFAHPTTILSMSILLEPLHYRSSAGIGVLKPQATQGGFAVPAGGFYRTYGVYLDPATGSYVNTSFSDTATLPWTYPAFTGNQRASCYVHLYPGSTVIKAGDDGTNGWIEDARVFLSGSSPASIPVAVSEGGTGVITLTAGLLLSPGGTTPVVTVPATTTVATALALNPGTTPGASDSTAISINSPIATGTTSFTNASTLDVVAPTKASGTGTITNGYAARFFGPASGLATNSFVALFKTALTSSIGIIVDTVASPTGLLQSWRANGTEVAAVRPDGGIYQGSNSAISLLTQAGTFASGNATAVGINQAVILKPNAAGGNVFSAIFANASIDLSATGGASVGAYGVYIGPVAKTGAGTVPNAYGMFINTPTAGTANIPLAFSAPAGAIAQEAWTAVSVFTNSWTNNALAYAPAGYMKDSVGFIHLRGQVVGGAANTSAFTLPTGYRCVTAPLAYAVLYYTGTTWSNTDVVIGATGLVQPETASAAGSMVGLNGIIFDTQA